MGRNNISNVGKVIKELMAKSKLDNRLEELDALDVWKMLIGKQLQTYVTDVKIYQGKLYVKLTSSTLRSELSYKKTDLINTMNKKIGKQLVKDIIFK